MRVINVVDLLWLLRSPSPCLGLPLFLPLSLCSACRCVFWVQTVEVADRFRFRAFQYNFMYFTEAFLLILCMVGMLVR